jgi:hypothetical protein
MDNHHVLFEVIGFWQLLHIGYAAWTVLGRLGRQTCERILGSNIIAVNSSKSLPTDVSQTNREHIIKFVLKL